MQCSLIVWAERDVTLSSPILALDQGRSVITVICDDIENLLARLEALDVSILEIHTMSQPATTASDLLLEGESAAVLHSHAWRSRE